MVCCYGERVVGGRRLKVHGCWVDDGVLLVVVGFSLEDFG